MINYFQINQDFVWKHLMTPSWTGTWQSTRFRIALEWWSLSGWKREKRTRRRRWIWKTDILKHDIRMIFHIIVLCPNVHAKTWISIDPCIKDDSGERERRGLIGVDIKRLYSVNIINSFRGIRHSSFVTTERDAIWNMFHPHPVSFMCLCKLFHLRKYTIHLWCFPNLEGWTCLLKWP